VEEFGNERHRMVCNQIIKRGLKESRLLSAFENIPRHLFVAEEQREWAYDDHPLPIGHHQTISQPYIVALMVDLLLLNGDECVLEVGTGSGYQAAILSQMVAEVHTVEIIPDLAEAAAQIMVALNIRNVHVHVGDGSQGWPESAPYDGIIVAAAAPKAPQSLLDQLAMNGRLVLPVGDRFFQVLERWFRRGDHYDSETIVPVVFVPLRGQYGFNHRW
jgi:protein-L-isoaspartate(D-aspartate) O-methyltransferase